MESSSIRFIPLGGLGEIGMNMMVFESANDIIVIDCGVMFPEEETPGVDLIIPEITYLLERKDKLRGIILTHGHEDHVGALPFFLQQLNVPLYGTRLTLGLIEPKLREFDLLDQTQRNIVKPRDQIILGDFRIEFIRVTHSIVDGVGLGIHTPIGTIVHSGDFKIDPTPVDGELMDLHKFTELGEQGVLLLLSDSTNVEREGYTLSEKDIGDTLDTIFAQAKGRIIAATFSSNIHRVQQIIDKAYKYGRSVAVTGKSMTSNVRIAADLGYLSIPENTFVQFGDIQRIQPDKTVIITTGSQGEPMSVLARLAMNEHKQIKINPGDTVIISARVIPGNEKSIARTINHLFRRGAEVYYERVSEIHVSGHASQEEQKLMLNMVRPKYFIPVHGEYRHLFYHVQLAQQIGIPANHTLIVEDGDIIELTPNSIRKVGETSANRVFVDGKGVGDVGDTVLRDRLHLASDGMFIIVIGINRLTGELVAEPEIVSRGFVFMEEAGDLIAESQELVKQILAEIPKESKTEWAIVKSEVTTGIRRFLYKRIERRPMILPVIIEL
ncbi:MAG: ribonuclease J [bacterium]|nr:ribonuclease J [bacterium]